MSTVTTPVVFLTSDHRRLRLLDGEWSYIPADPLAVSLALHTPTRQVIWRFGRDLLADAFVRPSGGGDVRLRPISLGGLPAHLVVDLSSPDGSLRLSCYAEPVWDFLQDTFGALPPCPWRGCDNPRCVECAAVRRAVAEDVAVAAAEVGWPFQPPGSEREAA